MRLSEKFIKGLYLYHLIFAVVMSISFVIMPLNFPAPGNLGMWLLIVILPLVVATFGFRLRVRMRSRGMANLFFVTNYSLAVGFTYLVVLTGEAGRGGRLGMVYLMSCSTSMVLWWMCTVVFAVSIPLVLVEFIRSRNKTTSCKEGCP